jgi:hypothetical protein
VLRAASVFGDVFWLEGVGALVGGTPAEVAPVLATLIAEEAIIAAEHPRLAGVSEFTFRHALLQGTAYATLTEEDRALGHRLAAAWLRDVLEDDDIVARHWLKGGEPKQAAAAFRSAAERRMRRAQPDAAARSITRALVVLDAESAPAVPACIALLADALAVTRRVDVEDVIAGLEGHAPAYDASAPHAARAWVLSVVDRALGFLRAGAHPALVVTLASAACAVGALGDSATAKDLLDEASSGAAGDPRALRGVRFASARVASWSVNASAIVELLDEDTLPDDPAARHEGLSMLAWAVVTVGGHAALEHGLDLVRKAEATRRSRSEGVGGADPLEDHLAQVQTAKARTLCFGFAGEHARSAEAAEEGVALARRAGLRFEECAQLHNAAEQYCLSGNLERSRTRALESSVMAREIGADLLKRPNDMLLAYLDRDAERLTRIAETMSATGHPSLDLFAHYWLGRLLAETRAPGARLALERARRIAGDLAIRHVQEDCARTLAGLDAE